MKTVITVEGFNQLRERKLQRGRKLDRKEPVPAERRISFETAELLLACMTPQRLRMLEALREQPRSVTELAAVLHCDRRSVHRDLGVHHTAGLLKLANRVNPGHGRVQVVQATARNLELRTRL